MNRKPILIVALVIALATMSCGINIKMPMTQVKTGPEETEEISVPTPTDTTTAVDLTLSFGAGEMALAPGADGALVSGKATYNVPDFKPTITQDGTQVKIEQGDLNIEGIPNFNNDIKNKWDLKLANVPLNLRIKAGAYQGDFEFGGLNIQDLDISDGASNVTVNFEEPNPGEMDTFRYSTGASNVDLTGLANANFDTMIFKSGAGSYKLEFTGDLKRDATITIDSGISSVVIAVPEGVSAKVVFEGGLSNVDASNSWKKSGDTYTQEGTGPTLTFKVTMGAGNLELRNP